MIAAAMEEGGLHTVQKKLCEIHEAFEQCVGPFPYPRRLIDELPDVYSRTILSVFERESPTRYVPQSRYPEFIRALLSSKSLTLLNKVLMDGLFLANGRCEHIKELLDLPYTYIDGPDFRMKVMGMSKTEFQQLIQEHKDIKQIPSDFDYAQYLRNYYDLQWAAPRDKGEPAKQKWAEWHWIQHGKEEGRTYHHPPSNTDSYGQRQTPMYVTVAQMYQNQHRQQPMIPKYFQSDDS